MEIRRKEIANRLSAGRQQPTVRWRNSDQQTDSSRRKSPQTVSSNATGGSLSSAASSSGCSSVECSSLDTAPARYAGCDTPTAAHEQAESMNMDEQDFLELNELLYLRNQKRHETFAHPAVGCGEDRIALPATDDPTRGASMSEFSAFTLRKSIKRVCGTTRAHGAAKPRPRARRRASSVAATGGQKSPEVGVSQQNGESFRRDDCRQQAEIWHSANLVEFQQVAPEDARRNYWRRATMVGGQPPERLAATGRPVGRPSQPEKLATVAPLAVGASAQRSRARRSLPVPPPVVPLYKEATLLLGASDEEPKVDPLSSAGRLGHFAGGCFGPAPRGSHLSACEQQVNILNGANDNNDDSELHGNRNKADHGTANTNLGPNFNSRSKTTTKINTRMRRMSLGDSAPRQVGMDPKCARKFYCDLWEDLHGRQRPEAGDSCADVVVAGDERDNNTSGQVNLDHSGGNNIDNDDHETDVGSANGAEASVFVGGSSASSTFTKRTGKLLERLGLRFLANFSGGASSSGAKPADDGESSSSDAGKCARIFTELAVAPNGDKTTTTTTANKPELQLGDSDESPIYDTPEFCGHGEPAKAPEDARSTGSGQPAARSAVRPSMPPPPPPLLPAAKLAAMGSVRAPQLPRSRLEGDCASSGRSGAGFRRCGRPIRLASGRFTCHDDSMINCGHTFEVMKERENDQRCAGPIIDHQSKPNGLRTTSGKENIGNKPTTIDGIRPKHEINVRDSGKKAVRWAKQGDTSAKGEKLTTKTHRGSHEHSLAGNELETPQGKLRRHQGEELKADRKQRICRNEKCSKVSHVIKLETATTNNNIAGCQSKHTNHSEGTSKFSQSRPRSEIIGFNQVNFLAEHKTISTSDTSSEACRAGHSAKEKASNKAPTNTGIKSNGAEIDFSSEVGLSKSPKYNQSCSKFPIKSPGNLVANCNNANMGASHSAPPPSAAHQKETSSAPMTSSAAATNLAASSHSKAGLKSQPGEMAPDKETKDGYLASTKISSKSSDSGTPSQANEQDQPKRKFQLTIKANINNNNSGANRPITGNQQQSLSHCASTCQQLLNPIKSFTESKQQHASPSTSVRQLRVGPQATDLIPPKSEESIERRRKSIQDGDVFIYPTLYKNLNECQRCSRDNKICSCNTIEPPEIECTSLSPNKSNRQVSVTAQASSKTTVTFAPPPTLTETTTDSSNNKKPLKKCQELIRVAGGQQGAAVSNVMESRDSGNGEKVLDRIQCNNSGDCFGHRENQIKTVYKISIATASIDKKSNQLRLSPPKVIGSSQLIPDPIEVACNQFRYQDTRENFKHDHEARIVSNNKRTPPTRTNRVNFLLDETDTVSARSSGALDGEKTIPMHNAMVDVAKLEEGQTGELSSKANVENTTTAAAYTGSPTPKAHDLGAEDTTDFRRSKASHGGESIIDYNNNNNSTECDRSTSEQKHAIIIRKLMEEQERNSEEQLTCNLSVGGDSIKITSTSIRSIGNKEQIDNSSLSSIIPIQTLSTRRRNQLANKMNRQAFFQDNCGLVSSNKIQLQEDRLVALAKQTSLEEEGAEEEDELASQANQNSSSDALEYSPILTSVRDYIKNVNTAELQVQSPSNTLGANCVELPISLNQITIRNSTESMEGCSIVSTGHGTPLQPSLTAMSSGCTNIVVPTTIVTSTTGALTLTSNSSITTPTSGISSNSNNKQTATSFTAKPGPSGGLQLIHQGASELHSDSPKKSIFDGASKDEILEYLEDARERVPDILMAADDVVVINENELIVVNQLEPGSPATPISIVEATEIMGQVGELVPLSDSGGNCGQQLLVAAAPTEQVSLDGSHSPDRLRHRLQQIYQTSSQLMSVNSQFSSVNNTMDEDTGISSSDQLSGLSSKVDSNRNSIDTPLTPNELKLSGASRQMVKNFACLSGATVESVEDQEQTSMAATTTTGIIAPNEIVLDTHIPTTTTCNMFTMNYAQHQNPKEQILDDGPHSMIDGESSQTMDLDAAGAIKTNSQQQQEINTTTAGLMGGGFRMLNFEVGLEARRRNSTSSEGSNRANSSQGANNCTIQMLRLKQRYSNRDSLSSPSTSPPSSASPSSSTSSNQTSGNCSAASTFYASSSLSCSSPLLALNITATNSIPMALSGQMSQLIGNGHQHQAQTSVARYSDQYHDLHMLDPLLIGNNSSGQQNSSPECLNLAADFNSNNNPAQVERDDSGLGSDYMDRNRVSSVTSYVGTILDPLIITSLADSKGFSSNCSQDSSIQPINEKISPIFSSPEATKDYCSSDNAHDKIAPKSCEISPTKILTNEAQLIIPSTSAESDFKSTTAAASSSMTSSSINQNNNKATYTTSSMVRFNSSANLMSRSVHGHYATMNRLNNYFMNRHPLSETNSESTVEFQCLDCDQFIDVDHATMMHKSNDFRLLRGTGENLGELNINKPDDGSANCSELGKDKLMTTDQLDRAYIAAMNGLPLCSSCEKKRVERKEIISEFVETELKYGRDLKIIHDEFYRPMQIAGLLSKDQITGVFLNLKELIVAHCKFAIRLEAAIRDAHSMGDTDFNTVNIGRLFVESSEMLHTFESYCIRQGSAACLLARLAKEKELLRIFLRVSQMENTLLRRMNLAAFLMVPVQRVTKYPLLLNRLYKVTAYHHKDREVLRDAQLKVELHLEHINQQTKGVGATNKIWRRISNLSAPISNRRCLINAEDIGYIKLRKTAMDMLKWDRDETKFIHSGRLNFAPLNEFLTKQKMKPIRQYIAAHALLIVLGKPNWKYRPDLVKSNLDNKLMTPTPGGNGVKEAALLLFREKGGRFIPCREPLFLSNCVLSADCSQYNSECPVIQPNHHSNQKAVTTTNSSASGANSASTSSAHQTGKDCSNNAVSSNNSYNSRSRLPSSGTSPESLRDSSDRSGSTESATLSMVDASKVHKREPEIGELRANSSHSDSISMASVKSLPDNHATGDGCSPPTHTSRSYSLASALPRTAVSTSSSGSLTKSSSITSSNLTIINQLMTKVNSYGHKQQQSSTGSVPKVVLAATGEQHKTGTTMAAVANSMESSSNVGIGVSSSLNQQLSAAVLTGSSDAVTTTTNHNNNVNRASLAHPTSSTNSCPNNNNNNEMIHPQYYNHLFFNNHHHHQPYGDYEESFEIHERLTKESMLLRADTPLKTRYWLQMLRYHAKDLGQWRARRNGLANIMMMRQE